MSASYLDSYKDESQAFMSSSNRALANLECSMDIDNKAVQNTGKFYDVFDGSNDLSSGLLDTTATTLTSAYSAGISTVAVASVTGFVAGQEVTIYDDVGSENKVIQTVGASSLTFTSVTANAYKNGAGVARSNVVLSGGKMGFGSAVSYGSGTVDRSSPVTISTAAHNPGGRILLRMPDQSFIVGLTGSSNNTLFLRSADSGTTWTQICYITWPVGFTALTIASYGNNVYAFINPSSGSSNYFGKFDFTTVTNTNQGYSTIDTGQTSFGVYGSYGVTHIATDSSGGIHAVWASINSTYPNSLNLRYSKSTNGGVSWAVPTQLTTYNSSGGLIDVPNITINPATGNPVILYWFFASGTGTNYVYCLRYTTSWLSPVSVYSNGTPEQHPGSLIFSPDGNLHAVWSGSEAGDTNGYMIKYSKSTDGGATWSGATTLATGTINYRQTIPSVTADSSNNIYVVWQGQYSGGPATEQIRKIVYSSGSWGSITNLTTSGTNLYVSICSNLTAFTDPVIVYTLSGTGTVFRGVFTGLSTISTPLLTSTARYNITPPLGTAKNFTAWVQKERAATDANFTVAAASSIGTTESYTTMTKTTTNFNASLAEEAFTMLDATANAKTNLRLTLTRASTSNTEKITKVLGAINR